MGRPKKNEEESSFEKLAEKSESETIKAEEQGEEKETKKEKTRREAAIPEAVVRAAAQNGVDPNGLLAWKIYPDGKVVLVAGNGMKFTQEAA